MFWDLIHVHFFETFWELLTWMADYFILLKPVFHFFPKSLSEIWYSKVKFVIHNDKKGGKVS